MTITGSAYRKRIKRPRKMRGSARIGSKSEKKLSKNGTNIR